MVRGSDPKNHRQVRFLPEPTTSERLLALRAAGEVLDGVLRDARRFARAARARPRPERGAHLVLVVEDQPEARELYQIALRSDGFRVAGAADGAEAVEKAIALAPDIIVMDFAMPGVDGGEAVRRLGADERTRSAPVLLISAFAERVPRDLRLQCAAFLSKPCDIE
jgi:two-component system cell cycle response regulator DivK